MSKRTSLLFIKRENLTVIEELFHPTDYKQHRIRCKCDCGNEIITRRSGFGKNTKSCGCLQKKAVKITALNNRTFSIAAMNRQYYNHVNNAHSRNWKPLNRESWNKLVLLPCYYCGTIDTRNSLRTHTKGQKREDLLYTEEEKLRYIVNINGIDRLNNNIDYTVENSVPCCGWCNTMKRNYTEKEFLEKIKSIYNHKIKQSSLT